MVMEVFRKSQPTGGDIHINRPLTNISIAYLQNQSEFIADKVFPVVPVPKRSDKYFIYTKADMWRDEARKRPPGTESVGSGFTMSTDTYYADVWAFHKLLDDQDRANADEPINLDADSTDFVTQRLLISRERQFVTNYFATGVWANETTPGNLWSDFTNSDPIGNVTTGLRTVKTSTGFKPNTLLLGGEVWDILKQHPDIRELFKYSNKDSIITLDMVAKAFDVEKVVVGDAIYNTTGEGATASYAQIYGKHALLCYANPRPALRQPSAGYIFAWTGYGGRNAYGVTINKLRDDHKKSDKIEGELSYDMKAVGTDLGYFFLSVVA